MSKKSELLLLKKNLKFLRTSKKLSIQEMSKLIGAEHRATYYSWERGDSQPNIKTILKIAHDFDISVDELLNTDLSINTIPEKNNQDDVYNIEMVPYKAVAGYSSCYSDPEWREENIKTLKIPYKPPYGEVRAFPVVGDSMEPKVKDGSYIVAVKLQNLKEEIEQGKDYIIVTKNDGIMYKIFYWKDINEGKIQLVSINQAHHPPFEILATDIIQVWNFFCTIYKSIE